MTLLDRLTAPVCSFCDALLTSADRGLPACRHCVSGLPFRFPDITLKHHTDFLLLVPFWYEGDIARAINALKFYDRTDFAPVLGFFMAQAAVRHGVRADAAVPVPLHPDRRAARGYNQAERLSRDVSRRLDIAHVPDLLRRRIPTPPLSQMRDPDQRSRTVTDAFVTDNGRALTALKDRPVFLVDDVMTSGATLRAASRPLIEAGLRVIGLTVASRSL